MTAARVRRIAFWLSCLTLMGFLIAPAAVAAEDKKADDNSADDDRDFVPKPHDGSAENQGCLPN